MIDHLEFYELVQRDATFRATLDAAIQSYLDLERKRRSNGKTSSLTARMRNLNCRLTFARRAEDLLAMYGRAMGRMHPPSDLEQISAIVADKATRQAQPRARGAPAGKALDPNR